MDARGGKLLEFLKENNHLDLEVPDIAFSIKKSEKTVEAALQKLQQKGLVTARQNEYGRVYWYALPSAPITRTFKLDELKAIKEEFVNENSGMEDEEVDLSDLQKISPPASEPEPEIKLKARAPKAPRKPARRKKKTEEVEEVAENTEIPSPAEETFPASVEVIPEPEKVIEESPVTDNVSSAEEEFISFENGSTVEEPKPSIESSDTDESEPAIKKFDSSIYVLPALLIIALISFAGLMRGSSAVGKIEKVQKAIPQDVVTTKDLAALKTEIAKMGDLEKKVTGMNVVIDSLKSELDSLIKNRAAPAPVKKIKRSSKRRRR